MLFSSAVAASSQHRTSFPRVGCWESTSQVCGPSDYNIPLKQIGSQEYLAMLQKRPLCSENTFLAKMIYQRTGAAHIMLWKGAGKSSSAHHTLHSGSVAFSTTGSAMTLCWKSLKRPSAAHSEYETTKSTKQWNNEVEGLSTLGKTQVFLVTTITCL